MIEIVKKIIPKKLKNQLIKSKIVRFTYGEVNGENKLIRERIKLNKELENQLRKKTKLKVAFFVLSDSVWKMDNLYLEMEKDKYFEPIIIICPWVNLGKEKMEYEMNKTEKFFKEKDYNYLKAIKENGEYLDIEQEIKPDIIFYTNPYKGLIDDRYYITNMKRSLCCYIPYYFDCTSLYVMCCDLLFHNLLWKFFVPTEKHLKYLRKHSRVRGENAIVQRYGILEEFHSFRYGIEKSKSKKWIIWAPHHTISKYNAGLEWSTFEKYYSFMLKISEKYKNEVKMIFKPHPMLYSRLVEIWGKEKVDSYYNQWSVVSYRGIELGDYTELFYKSDALIHDSGSFTIEYLYFRKPVCRLINKKNFEKMLTPFDKEAWNCHELAYSEEDISDFIENVINNQDKKVHEKIEFYKKYLEINENNKPSKNIIGEIKKYFE